MLIKRQFGDLKLPCVVCLDLLWCRRLTESKLQRACECGPGTWVYDIQRLVKEQKNTFKRQGQHGFALSVSLSLLAHPCLLPLISIAFEFLKFCNDMRRFKCHCRCQPAWDENLLLPQPLPGVQTSPYEACTWLTRSKMQMWFHFLQSRQQLTFKALTFLPLEASHTFHQPCPHFSHLRSNENEKK